MVRRRANFLLCGLVSVPELTRAGLGECLLQKPSYLRYDSVFFSTSLWASSKARLVSLEPTSQVPPDETDPEDLVEGCNSLWSYKTTPLSEASGLRPPIAELALSECPSSLEAGLVKLLGSHNKATSR